MVVVDTLGSDYFTVRPLHSRPRWKIRLNPKVSIWKLRSRQQAEGALVPRILGFDVGDRRIGLAISDPLGYTAQPLFTLHRAGRRADLKAVARVLRKHGVTEVVVGNPLYMSGDQSPQAAKAQAFAEDAAEGVRDNGASLGRAAYDDPGAPTSRRRRARCDRAQRNHRPGGGGVDSAVVSGGPSQSAGPDVGPRSAPLATLDGGFCVLPSYNRSFTSTRCRASICARQVASGRPQCQKK